MNWLEAAKELQKMRIRYDLKGYTKGFDAIDLAITALSEHHRDNKPLPSEIDGMWIDEMLEKMDEEME